ATVSVVEMAAGAAEGVITLGLPEGGNSGCYSAGAAGPGARYEARVARLDDLLAGLGVARVDLVKMDIEGSECEALRGATGLLRTHQPPILVELNERALRGCGSSSEEVKGLLHAEGYHGVVVGRKGLEPLGDVGPRGC